MNTSKSLDWTPIPGFPHYEVTSTGLVRSLHSNPPKLLKQSLNPQGYYAVGLCENGKSSLKRVHRLVLETFTPTDDKTLVSCHGDGVRTNNNLSNLRWDTQANNYADSIKHGTANRGERHGSAKLTKEKALAIREARERGVSSYRLADKYGVSQNVINRIGKRLLWKHV